MVPKIGTDFIVHKDRAKHCAFTDITRLPGGELGVVFREGLGHVEPTGRVVMAISEDGGRTWEPDLIEVRNGPDDDRDPSIRVLSDGSVLVNHFTYGPFPEGRTKAGVSGARGLFTIRSTDGGRTWQEPRRAGSEVAACSDAVLELPSGRLLLPAYYGRVSAHWGESFVLISEDGGESWDGRAVIARDPRQQTTFGEPALLSLPDGRILALLRAEEGANRFTFLFQSESRDGGVTWTEPKLTPMWGHPAHLLLLGSGAILCTYGHRRRPMGVRGCLSRDGGRTWEIEREFMLRGDGAQTDLGYPSSVQLDDGTIVTSYYHMQEDGVAHIAATRWSEAELR